MIRKISLLIWMSIFSMLSYAQGAGNPLTQLTNQCQQLMELEKEIAEKQAKLDSLNNVLDVLESSWAKICSEVIDNPNHTQEDLQILLSQTDKDEEKDLYGQLEEALKIAPTGGSNQGTAAKKAAPSKNSRQTSQPRSTANPTKATEGVNDNNEGGAQGKKSLNAEDETVVDPDNKPLKDSKKEKGKGKENTPEEPATPVNPADPKNTSNSGKEDITKKTHETTTEGSKNDIIKNRMKKSGNS